MTRDEIKDLRTRMGITQEKFSQMLGVTHNTYNRWENGRCKPSRLALEKLEQCNSLNRQRELLKKQEELCNGLSTR
jgi:transcriptional regulator with XRE-family HTH domain